MQEQYIPQRVKDINAQIAAQGNKGYSVAPSELYSPTVFTDSNIRETTIPSIVSKAKKLVGNDSNPPILDDKGNTLAVYNRNIGGYRDVNSGQEYQSTGATESTGDTNEYESLYKQSIDSLGIPLPEEDPYFKLIESMQSRSDASTQNLLSAVSSEYQQLRSDLQRSQESTTAQLRGAQRRLGSRYTPLTSPQTMQTKLDSDMRAMSDLTSKEAIDKNKILSAQADKDFELMGKQIEVLESRRKEKATIAEKIIDDIQAERKKNREQEIQASRDNAIAGLIQQGISNPAEILFALNENGGDFTAKEISESVKNLIKTNTYPGGIIGEYQFYVDNEKANGRTPVDFNSYQTLDANRRIAIAKAGVAYGGYDTAQQKAIDQINTSISNNPTYKKLSSMQTYISNVEAGLSQKTGVGDIAAINQFQKVIDEGAVTRDQDVVLIQSAQSLSNTLQTKISKLQKGELLSPELRKEMLEVTNKMLEAQKKAVYVDPGISAQKKKADRYEVDINETIIGELESANKEYDFDSAYIKNTDLQPDIDQMLLDGVAKGDILAWINQQ